MKFPNEAFISRGVALADFLRFWKGLEVRDTKGLRALTHRARADFLRKQV